MKTFKYLAIAAVAAFAVTGCSDEQTGFNVQDVPGRAIIKGHVEYTTGTTMVNGKFVYEYLPAANLTLKLVVPNTDYSSNLSGQSVFETVTDEEGNYSIEIPAPLQNYTNVSIQSDAFEGTRNTIQIVNNEIVTVSETVIYSVNSTYGLTFVDGGICIKNLVCGITTPEAVQQGYSTYTTLTGKIGRNAEYYIAPEKQYETVTTTDEEGNTTETEQFVGWKSAEVLPCFVPAPNADMILTVTESSLQTVYNVTTDANGEFTLDVLVKEFPANYTYSIQIVPQQDATFTHYEAEEVEYEDPTYVAPETTEEEGEDAIATETETETEVPMLTYTDYKATTLSGWYGFYRSAAGVSGSFSVPVQAYVAKFEAKALIFATQDEETTYYASKWYASDIEWQSEIEERLAEEAAAAEAEKANK